MKQLALLLVFLLVKNFAVAQNNIAVSGKVMERQNTPVMGAGVFLFNGIDTLKTVTDTAGRYFFWKMKTSNFTLQVRSLGYATYQKKYDLAESRNIKLDPIFLKEEPQMLKNVEIKGRLVPFRMKGDTLEYDAAAYKTLEKDRVNELIRQLPGMQVDKNGDVTSMGKKLTKIRVNGQDFFTGDVKEFLSKLPADIVSKVQVIDDYGEEANFTGLKIGTPQKILNLVTKDKINRGNFGGAQVDAGTNKQFGALAGYNFWREAKQVALDAKVLTQNNGVGTSSSSQAGISYNDKFKSGANLVTNYAYTGNYSDQESESSTETAIGEEILKTERQNSGNQSNKSHKLNVRYVKSFKKQLFSGSINAELPFSSASSLISSSQSELIRQDLMTRSSKTSRTPYLNFDSRYTLKFKKAGSLSINLTANTKTAFAKENLYNQIGYYNQNSGVLEKDSIDNRYIDERNQTNFIRNSISYGIPLKKKPGFTGQKSLRLSYSLMLTKTNNRLATFGGTSSAALLVDTLSSKYNTLFLNQAVNFGYSFFSEKWKYNVSVQPRLMTLTGDFPNQNQGIHRSYFNLSPLGNLQYDNKGKQLSIMLRQEVTPPSFSQVLPVPETRDLQRITIGNPNLKPEISPSLDFKFSNHSLTKGSVFFATVTGVLTQDKIVTNTVLVKDTLGSRKQELRYANADGSIDISTLLGMEIPLNKQMYFLAFNNNLNYGNNVNFSESIKGFNKAFTVTSSLGFRVNKTKLMGSAFVRYGVTSTKNTFGNQFIQDVKYWGFNTEWRLTLSPMINAAFDLDKQINSGYTIGNNNPFIINFNVERFIFKKKARIKLNAFDILKQGNNLQRSFIGNSTTDSRSNQVTRYFSLSFIFNIDQFGGAMAGAGAEGFNLMRAPQ